MAGGAEKRAVLIAGPTASGKSALALRLARERGGVVINADAMQVYGVLRILTARPSEDDMGEVPHRLYGFVPPKERFSTGDWLRAVQPLLHDYADRPLIFVGGTGLYFDALMKGFAEVPEVPEAARLEAEAAVAGLGRTGRAELIALRDPLIASRLKAPDPQRVARALAVFIATGRSLAEFQDESQKPLLADDEVERIVVDPGRDILRARIAERFERMLEGGAVAEVEALQAMNVDPALPAMKAIGVPEIAGMLRGELTREQAIEQAVIATRQYAKRQRTWLRNRMGDWPRAES